MITVNSLLSTQKLKSLRVLAGHSGLNRDITSVSIMDAPDSYKWLRGGELILTTGFIFGGDEWQLEHFISNLIDADCAAVGVKKGRFLNAIPETIIRIANRHMLPIIEIPYVFGWSDIISEYYDLKCSINGIPNDNNLKSNPLQEHKHKSADNDDEFYRSFLLKLHSCEVVASDLLEYAKHCKHSENKFYGVLLIKGIRREYALSNIRATFNSPRLTKDANVSLHIVDFETEHTLVVLMTVTCKRTLQINEWQYIFVEELEYCVGGESDSCVSVGRLYTYIDGIVTSYQEAVEAHHIGNIIWQERSVYHYAILSVYSTLVKSCLSDISLDYIDTLEVFQKNIEFSLIENLEVYIEHGCKKAATKLFVHENTLRYRMHKIAEILHIDLNDTAICNILLFQIKLWKLRLNMLSDQGIQD